ncbi:AzlD domain-containing protein [Microbulbifer sp. CAU 1566]|uniref:AzlD domain-containing protein n=1 Tax=Microbulbifer sp. CAU 1566 TaxID=2933269 RepID=UPI0020056410|nr:AzlD domain-containing protein [Microbulbifer sp. CAU 1566]MCK7596762.1 AzlD domain-containing protein [Microbulbifer sp. CAU 1566]
MGAELWAALIAAAIGTYLMRALPLVWMRRHLLRRSTKNTLEAMPTWLSVLGPLMIAAMFGVSLVPSKLSLASGLATVFGVLVTMVVWQKTRSLGWPVLAGVAVYGVVIFLASFLV